MGCVSVRRYHHNHISACKSGFSELVLIGCYRKFGNLIKCLFFFSSSCWEKVSSRIWIWYEHSWKESTCKQSLICWYTFNKIIFSIHNIRTKLSIFIYTFFITRAKIVSNEICMFVLRQTCEYNICIQLFDILTKQHNPGNLFLQKSQ